MVHDCNLSTWVIETELQAGGQPGLHSENLCPKPKQTVRKKRGLSLVSILDYP